VAESRDRAAIARRARTWPEFWAIAKRLTLDRLRTENDDAATC
jgi:hypothetical protein